jgi:hypothetical protein
MTLEAEERFESNSALNGSWRLFIADLIACFIQKQHKRKEGLVSSPERINQRFICGLGGLWDVPMRVSYQASFRQCPKLVAETRFRLVPFPRS